MAAVGNLNEYVKFQMAQGMEKGGSPAGMATELAVGLSMAQQIIQDRVSDRVGHLVCMTLCHGLGGEEAIRHVPISFSHRCTAARHGRALASVEAWSSPGAPHRGGGLPSS
mgnify:CR=1 FL=1